MIYVTTNHFHHYTILLHWQAAAVYRDALLFCICAFANRFDDILNLDTINEGRS
jgi:hypothetical protein